MTRVGLLLFFGLFCRVTRVIIDVASALRWMEDNLGVIVSHAMQ